MAEAPHGTAPSLQGKNVANPMAMLLALAAVLDQAGPRSGDARYAEAGTRLRAATLEGAAEGCAPSTLAARRRRATSSTT